MKEIYSRKKEMAQLSTIDNETSIRVADQDIISNRFMKEVQRNLQHIKKIKEINRIEKEKKKGKAVRYANLEC